MMHDDSDDNDANNDADDDIIDDNDADSSTDNDAVLYDEFDINDADMGIPIEAYAGEVPDRDPRRSHRGTNGTRTGPKAMARHERHLKILALRRSGHTWLSIAEQCGYASPSGAYHAAAQIMNKLEIDSARELRDLHHVRLEYLLTKHWGKAESGNISSTKTVLGILDRIERLWGLSDYQRLEATAVDAGDDDLPTGAVVIGGDSEQFLANARKIIAMRDGA